MVNKIIYIYGLHNGDDIIRYVGKTDDLKRRLRQHNSNARKEISHKVSWISNCKKQGLVIKLLVLEECTPENWEDREKFWITQFSTLTNHHIGGKGGTPIKYKISYEECKKWVKENLVGVDSISKWEKIKKELPDFITPSPSVTYNTRGWVTWGSFFETGRIADITRHKNFLPYEDAKKFIKKFNFQSNNEYKKYWDENKPTNLPKCAMKSYSRNGDWVSVKDYLGYGNTKHGKKNFLTYEEAKKFLKPFKLQTVLIYKTFQKDYHFLPAKPNIVYKEWINWKDYLNK